MSKTVKMIVALIVAFGFAVLPALAAEKPVITLEKVEVASIRTLLRETPHRVQE